MTSEEIKIYISNKAWEYRWALNNLDLNENDQNKLTAKSEALFDLLSQIKNK